MSNIQKVSVLFICMGNICRSPTAEGVFASLVAEEELAHRIVTDSAGTHAYHIGSSPDNRAQATAENHGVNLSHLVARKVSIQDLQKFDYVIAMDHQNLIELKALEAQSSTPIKSSLHLFMEFTENWQNEEVPDPYYGGVNGFEEVYQMVKDASQGLLMYIKNPDR